MLGLGHKVDVFYLFMFLKVPLAVAQRRNGGGAPMLAEEPSAA